MKYSISAVLLLGAVVYLTLSVPYIVEWRIKKKLGKGGPNAGIIRVLGGISCSLVLLAFLAVLILPD